MSMNIPTGVIRNAGSKISDMASKMQSLARRADSINSEISRLYMHGGVGSRAGIAASQMHNTASQALHKGESLIVAANIYEMKEKMISGRAGSIANTIGNGVDISWISHSPIMKILQGIEATKSWIKSQNSIIGRIGITPPVVPIIPVIITGNRIREIIEKSSSVVPISDPNRTIRKPIGNVIKTPPSKTEVRVGEIRFVSQVEGSAAYDKDSWPPSVHPKSGCIAAAKSMALSSMGIDHLPKDMNLGTDGYVNEDYIKTKWDLKQNICGDKQSHSKRVEALDSYLENYLSDPSKYSPPVIRVTTYSGGHSMIVVGKDETGYRVVDSGGFGWDHYKVSTDGYVSDRSDSEFVSGLTGVFQYVRAT